MRLLITAGPPDIWVRLEPESGEEAMALEACAARGEWTNGHGADAIVRLQALATRLGFPVTRACAAGPGAGQGPVEDTSPIISPPEPGSLPGSAPRARPRAGPAS
jgi:hypothetical protein